MQKFLPVILLTIMLASCNNQAIPTGVSTNPTTESWGCGLIQEEIDDLDLSGEWRAEFNAYGTDTLFINENGFYVQKFIDTASGYQYVSPEPNKWYLEEVPGGGTYIHLEGMLDCEGFGSCVNPINIEDYYDVCGGKWFHLRDEFILAINGDSRISQGLSLKRIQPAGCETCFEDYYYVEK